MMYTSAGAAEGAQVPTDGAQGTIPNAGNAEPPAPPAGDTAPPAGDFSIPEEYKDKGYLKDVNSYDDVFKKLDGSQQLIGKRNEAPAADASAEEWGEYYKGLGRPDEASAYEFQYEEGKAPENTDFDDSMKKVFHEAGLTQKQALTLQAGFNAKVSEMTANIDPAKADEDFDNLATKVFGDNKDQILSDAKKMIESNKPEGMDDFDGYLKGLGNNDLIVMASVLNNVKGKYVNEDKINGAAGSSGEDREGLQAEGRALMASPDFKNSFSPNHEKVKARVSEIYATLGKA